jgi:hypothetical protein
VAGNYKSKGSAGSLRLTVKIDGTALASLNEGFPEPEPQLATAEKQFAEQAAVSLGRRKIGRRNRDSYYGVVFLGAVAG